MSNLVDVFAENPVVLDAGDLGYTVENTGTAPIRGGFKYGQLMFNRYKITPAMASNDLILAMKHLDNTDPSTDRPLYFKIGNSVRALTANLSVTKADGTNWANLGSAELAANPVELFAYVVWNTNLTPDAVDIFWSRVPYGKVFSDFSATATAWNYAAVGATAPASTDECANIGRFEATLSAGAGHTWTVPTYTNKNLVQFPIFNTKLLGFTPVASSDGGSPVNVTKTGYYWVENNCFQVLVDFSVVDLGTATGGMISTSPFPSIVPVVVVGNEVAQTAKVISGSFSTSLRVFLEGGATPWINTYTARFSAKGIFQ